MSYSHNNITIDVT